MIIAAIDPGTTKSAYAIYDSDNHYILQHGHADNDIVLELLRTFKKIDVIAVESIVFYSRALGDDVYQTVKMIGMVQEVAHVRRTRYVEVNRPTIVWHFTGVANLKKAATNEVLKKRFGGKGTKKQPGILYGIRQHEWDAFAVACWVMDGEKRNPDWATSLKYGGKKDGTI